MRRSRRGELFVDTRAGAFSESGELIGALARGIIDRSAVRGELSQLASGTFRRSHALAITIFKSVGTALEDLAAAQLALRQSERMRSNRHCSPASLVEIDGEGPQPMTAFVMLSGDGGQRRVAVQFGGGSAAPQSAHRPEAGRAPSLPASTRG